MRKPLSQLDIDRVTKATELLDEALTPHGIHFVLIAGPTNWPIVSGHAISREDLPGVLRSIADRIEGDGYHRMN